jgi:hypothetical protein
METQLLMLDQRVSNLQNQTNSMEKTLVSLADEERKTQAALLKLKISVQERVDVHEDSLRRLNAKTFGVAEVSVKYGEKNQTR